MARLTTREARLPVPPLLRAIVGVGLLVVLAIPVRGAGTYEVEIESTTGWTWQPAGVDYAFGDVISIRRVPRTNLLAFGRIDGRILVHDPDKPDTTPELLGSIEHLVLQDNERSGLKGFAFHPAFGLSSDANRATIFIAYVTRDWKRRLSRFAVSEETGQLVNDSEEVMIELLLPGGALHSIGELAFGQDGFLYVPVGDGHSSETHGPYGGTAIARDMMNLVQRIDDNLVGGVLRIDVDKDPLRSHPPRRRLPIALPEEISGVGYWIPNDNPFLDDSGALMEEYFTIGHRNPWKLTVDADTGELWVAEVGPSNGEEINRIVSGGNYGWPYRAGKDVEIAWDRAPPSGPTPDPWYGFPVEPVFSPNRSQARSILGGPVYRGDKFRELYGWYLCGDVLMRHLWAVRVDDSREVVSVKQLLTADSTTYAIEQSLGGDVYAVLNDELHKLVKTAVD